MFCKWVLPCSGGTPNTSICIKYMRRNFIFSVFSSFSIASSQIPFFFYLHSSLFLTSHLSVSSLVYFFYCFSPRGGFLFFSHSSFSPICFWTLREVEHIIYIRFPLSYFSSLVFFIYSNLNIFPPSPFLPSSLSYT